MAEIGTLGDIVFKVSANKVRTFDDLKIDSKTNYAKHTRGYEIVDTGEKDEDGKTITKREPVPFDMKKCTLVLWALI